MDLTFQVPMQYSLQHRTSFSPSDTSKTDCCFCFCPAASFFLELLVIALCSFPVAYWTPSNLGDSSFSVRTFCLFTQFMRFSWQVYWGGLPFPPPVDHVLSELSTMTHRLGWPYMASLTASLSYTGPLAMTRQ